MKPLAFHTLSEALKVCKHVADSGIEEHKAGAAQCVEDLTRLLLRDLTSNLRILSHLRCNECGARIMLSPPVGCMHDRGRITRYACSCDGSTFPEGGPPIEQWVTPEFVIEEHVKDRVGPEAARYVAYLDELRAREAAVMKVWGHFDAWGAVKKVMEEWP